MKRIVKFETGYSRGYVRVKDRGAEREVSIEKALLERKNSNLYKAAKKCLDAGCEKMTVCGYQHAHSSNYVSFVYKGYVD